MKELYNMNDIIDEEFFKTINNKKGIDDGTISIEDLSLEELENVKKLYTKEIYNLFKTVQTLENENKKLNDY